MNRYRKRDEAVSPVIATILMVAITVVLAGVLVAYLQTIDPDKGKPVPPLGVRLEKTTEGNWTMSIVQGRTGANGIQLQVTNPATAAMTVSGVLTASSAYFLFQDNLDPGYINAGDAILLNQSANFVQTGYRVVLVKDAGTLVAPQELR